MITYKLLRARKLHKCIVRLASYIVDSRLNFSAKNKNFYLSSNFSRNHCMNIKTCRNLLKLEKIVKFSNKLFVYDRKADWSWEKLAENKQRKMQMTENLHSTLIFSSNRVVQLSLWSLGSLELTRIAQVRKHQFSFTLPQKYANESTCSLEWVLT